MEVGTPTPLPLKVGGITPKHPEPPTVDGCEIHFAPKNHGLSRFPCTFQERIISFWFPRGARSGFCNHPQHWGFSISYALGFRGRGGELPGGLLAAPRPGAVAHRLHGAGGHPLGRAGGRGAACLDRVGSLDCDFRLNLGLAIFWVGSLEFKLGCPLNPQKGQQPLGECRTWGPERSSS